MKIGVIQKACSANPAENLERAVGKVKEAATNGAQIICLPELFRSQYFCQQEDAALFDLAESVPGPSTEALSQVAKTSWCDHFGVGVRAANSRRLSQFSCGVG